MKNLSNQGCCSDRLTDAVVWKNGWHIAEGGGLLGYMGRYRNLAWRNIFSVRFLLLLYGETGDSGLPVVGWYADVTGNVVMEKWLAHSVEKAISASSFEALWRPDTIPSI